MKSSKGSTLMIKIIPAILPKSFRELQIKLEQISGAAREVQIDICDGKFTPSKTWPFLEKGERGEKGETDEDFAAVAAEKKGLPFWQDFDFEFDLMVANPRQVIGDFVRAGASRCIIHLESIAADELSDLIHEWKHVVDVGIALKPKTPLSELEPFLHEISFVQCMGSNKIGFQGVQLDERVFERIADLRKRHEGLIISVDIGVNKETAPRLLEAGANRLVMGSAIFGQVDPRGAIKELQKFLHHA